MKRGCLKIQKSSIMRQPPFISFPFNENILECTQNLGQIIWKLVFYLLKLSLRKVIWKKYIDEFKMLILELLEEGKIEIIKKQSYIFK